MTGSTDVSAAVETLENGTPNHSNGSDGTDPSQAQNSDGNTPFLGYDDGREQARHRHGNDSTATTNSEEASNDADDDETKDPGGTSL